MDTTNSPFIASLPEKPEMRCIAFNGKSNLMRFSGWEQQSMAEARVLALAWINTNHGIEIFTIETTLADNHAVITVWYRSPFSPDKKPNEQPQPTSWE
jgi:hypothetical protein